MTSGVGTNSLPFTLAISSDGLRIVSPALNGSTLGIVMVTNTVTFTLIYILVVIHCHVGNLVTTLTLLNRLTNSVTYVSKCLPSIRDFALAVPNVTNVVLSVNINISYGIVTTRHVHSRFRGNGAVSNTVSSNCGGSVDTVVSNGIAVMVISVILVNTFNAPSDLLTRVFSPLVSLFNASVANSVCSFNCALLINIVFGLVVNIFTSGVVVGDISGVGFLEGPTLCKNGGGTWFWR